MSSSRFFGSGAEDYGLAQRNKAERQVEGLEKRLRDVERAREEWRVQVRMMVTDMQVRATAGLRLDINLEMIAIDSEQLTVMAATLICHYKLTL